MQPTVNLQNTSASIQALPGHLYSWEKRHLNCHFSYLWPQQFLADLFHVSHCNVNDDHMDEEWERTISGVKEHCESLCNILDLGYQKAIRISWKQLWSAPPCPAEGNLHHLACLLDANMWFKLSWLWILLTELVHIPWLLWHCTDSAHSDLSAEKDPSSWCKKP